MELSDLEWGDVLSDDDGILVVAAELDGDPVVVKRFANAEHRREISNYRLLARLDVPTLPVLGFGADWLVLPDLVDAGWRVGSPDDLGDPHVARLLAGWYARLHAAGSTLPAEELDGLFNEFDVVDAPSLAMVADRWPELALQVAWAQQQLPGWRAALATFPRTLTYNDFWYSNLAVAWEGSSALMFDYNLMGAGLRASDVRNVTVSLSPLAAEAFLAQYHRLIEATGRPLDPRESQVDEPLSHLATLILASQASEVPFWALDSLAWLGRQGG